MRNGCSLCSSGSVEKFHGAKHQRVNRKPKNNFIKDNYMIIIGAILVVAFLIYKKGRK